MGATGRRGRPLVLGLFAASGAVGLLYQVLWSRSLLDLIGVSAHSHATVLAAFMGGLALGNALLGPLADRVRRPLLLFAGLEAAVGAYGFAYGPLQRWVAGAYLASGAAHEALPRIALAALLLLPPTVLMGGTYPAVLRHVTSGLPEAGRRAAQAYAVNALGAAAGSLLAAFVVLPALGLRAGLLAVAGLNTAVAVIAAVTALRSEAVSLTWGAPPAGERPAEGNADIPTPESQSISRHALFWLGALFAAGFASFSLEIAWTRFLGLAIGSSSEGFALMLAAFIGGIGLGSALLARAEHRLRDPLAAWGSTQLFAATALLVPLPLLQYLPWTLLRVQSWFGPNPGGWVLFTLAKLALCLALMLPGTLALGVSLPLVIKGVARSLGDLGALAGRCYAANTAGNVLGAIAGGLVLLPALGVEGLLRTAALATGLLGFAVIFARLPVPPAHRRRRLAIAAGVVLALVATHAMAPAWDPTWFVFSPFRRMAVPPTFEQARSFSSRARVLMFEDDPAANVLVYEYPEDDGGFDRSLLVDGKAEATAFGDGSTQGLLAHIPLVLQPDARDVLVIGLASGGTAGAVLMHPVERLDVVELVSAMPRATRLFDRWNGRPLDDPRTRLLLRDARAHLAGHGPDYDLIVSEPSNPWMAGVASLFSAEFYAAAAARLRDGGRFAQWLHLYELDDASFLAALASFHDSFPRVAVFQTKSGDVLLLGARERWEPDWAASLDRSRRPAVARHLRRLRVDDLASLLMLQRLSPASVDLLLAGDPEPHTDDNRLLEHRAPVSLFMGSTVEVVERLDERQIASPALLFSRFAAAHPEEVRAESLLRLASWPWLAAGPLDEAWGAILLQTRPERAADPRLARLLPAAQLASPPPPMDALRTLLEAFASRAEGVAIAEEVAGTWSTAVLHTVAVDPDEGRLWADSSAMWGQASPALRRLRIEILMAGRSLADARGELLNWLAQPVPPRAGWALRAACLIDEDELCHRVRRQLEVVSP